MPAERDPSSAPLRSALLVGSEHTVLNESEVTEITPDLTIGISRGRFPKGYPHVDPNEDAVFASADEARTILAVADGHGGIDAAQAAVVAIAKRAPLLGDEAPDTAVRHLARAAIESVAAAAPLLEPPRGASETALTIVVIEKGMLATCTFGDTGCFIVTRRRATRIGRTTPFVTSTTDPDVVDVHAVSIKPESTVIVTSDGILDFTPNPGRALRSTWELPAAASVEHLVNVAFAGGAGDNIAIGVAKRS